MSFLDSPIFDAAEREWAEPPDDDPDEKLEESNDE